MHTVLNWLTAVWQFVVGFFPYLGDWIGNKLLAGFAALCDAVVSAFSVIPVPDFVTSASGLMASVPASVWWFANVVEFQFGLGVVLSAYTLRWVIKAVLMVIP